VYYVTLCAICFGFGFVGSMPLAGPIAVLMVSNTFRGRYAQALRLGFGAAIAETGYAFIACFGFVELLAKHKIVVPISHGVTAVVLVGLGGYFMRWKDHIGEHPEDPPSIELQRKRNNTAFVLGFTVCALNPTLLLTWSAATAALYSRGVLEDSWTSAIAFALAAGAGVTSWNLALIGLVKRYHEHFPRKALVWIVRGMGLLLVGVGVWSAVDLVRSL
jgi:threonine/homoserine/homoserine lactone efflux protein